MYASSDQQFISDSEGNPNMAYAAINQNDKEVIDAHLFVEALAMVCIDIAPSDYSFPEAVNSVHQFIFGLQRLDSSGGPTIVQKQLGYTR